MLYTVIMINTSTATASADSPPRGATVLTTPTATRLNSVSNNNPELDTLARHLAGDFPLHSPSELRRAILVAGDDLWPRRDSTEILDQARLRLQQGTIS
jgi:hypothetical protein